jgi:putative Mg2+ transporter-C (MgtC) family protein
MEIPVGELILRLVLAIAVGGLIGAEREFQDKAAGFRTLIFISIGAMLFSTFAIEMSPTGDGSRITANIVSGVGFLGAGVIMRESGKVLGLTTAATIWLTAALGMGIGGGQYVLTLVAMPFILVVLWLFPRIENLIDGLHMVRAYEVTCLLSQEKIEQLEHTI